MKKIIALLLLSSLTLTSVASCQRKNEPDISISYNENYGEPTQPEGTTTYRIQETPVKVDEGVDQDIADLLKSYFDGYNKTESFTVLKSYTPTAYMYWKSTYGEDAIMILNEVKSTTPLSDEQLHSALVYFKQKFSDYPFDIELTEGVEVTFNYSISGSAGEDSGDMTVCAVRIKEGETEFGGWKLIMCSAEELKEYK